MRQDMPGADVTSSTSTMDRLHKEFHQALHQLSISDDDAFTQQYSAFVQVVEKMFGIEEAWMEELDCSLIQSHREQHARVLGALHNVHTHVMHGDIALGRHVTQTLLPEWFALHTSTMDAALGAALGTAFQHMGAEAAAVWTVPERSAACNTLGT